MIIDIDDALFFKIKEIVKKRNSGVYKQLEHIKEIKATPDDILVKARAIKTNRKKEEIKKAVKELIHSKDMLVSNKKPKMYQVHKKTGIAYKTLHKYFEDIKEEVLGEIKF